MKRRETVETHFLGLAARHREKYDEDIRGEQISVEQQNIFKKRLKTLGC